MIPLPSLMLIRRAKKGQKRDANFGPVRKVALVSPPDQHMQSSRGGTAWPFIEALIMHPPALNQGSLSEGPGDHAFLLPSMIDEKVVRLDIQSWA